MLLFVHMHKCAGTTVRKSAAQSDLTLPDIHRNGNLIDRFGEPIFYAPMPEEEVRRIVREQRSIGIEFMAIEHDFPKFDFLPKKGVTYFTILRDPLQRAISNYRYAKLGGEIDRRMGFREAMSDHPDVHGWPLSQTPNYYVRKLAARGAGDALGVEDFETARQILRKFTSVMVMGVDDIAAGLRDLGIRRFILANVTAERNPKIDQPTPEELDVSEGDTQWFLQHNDLDDRLFRWATKRSLRAVDRVGGPA